MTVQEIFEEQAEKTPDNIAVDMDSKYLTYRELNEKANQLARKLRERGVTNGSIVGIMVERSFEMIIGMLWNIKSWRSVPPYRFLSIQKNG